MDSGGMFYGIYGLGCAENGCLVTYIFSICWIDVV